MKLVPNRPPKVASPDHRIAIIGEAPGEDEERFNEPFIGPSGHILRNLLSNSNIHPDSVLLANVCNYRPPNNNLKLFYSDGPQFLESKAILQRDLAEFNPNLCVLLGDTAIKAAGYRDTLDAKGNLSVLKCRGTLFTCTEESSPLYGRKCLATLHPAAALRQPTYLPLLRLDLARARAEGASPLLELPNPTLDIHLSPDAIIDKLDDIRRNGTCIALDIEGYVNNITCLSIATSRDYAFAADLKNLSDKQLTPVLRAIHRVARDPDVPKILQNSLYDNFALSWTYGAYLSNVIWDTMLSGWEIYPELPKGLGTQASIWTRHPAYKHEGKVDKKKPPTPEEWDQHLRYCCKDSVITYELKERHEAALARNEGAFRHFKLNMELLKVLMYMELRGTKYDKARAEEIVARSKSQLTIINDRINLLAGKEVNINSPKQLAQLLYKQLKFPEQYAKAKGGARGGLSTNVGAILTLQKTHQDGILRDILAFRKVDKIRIYSDIKCDADGRVRCGYNAVGTETGRLSCYESALETGTNLQVITKKLRGLYRADPEHYYFQIDLAGADGWTVAAHCARLGDRTMLDDYNAGLKPAKIIALMHEHGADVNKWLRDEIRLAGKDIGNGDTEWLYFACKRVQHGTNYGLGKRTMSLQILQDGYKYLAKTIIVPESTCQSLQRLYLLRYPGVSAWQQWIKSQLLSTCTLACASGHVRRFFGKPNDIQTIQAAYAHEPQANTTYATTVAMLNLWNDPDNRRPDGTLIIEPLHQVHDAINGQFPIDRTEWAVQKLRKYMDNECIIAGRAITIPYEGFYGPSWGDCDPNHGTPVGTI